MTKCNRCGHEWQTKSTHVFVSCPSCYKKVKIREFKEVVGEALSKELDEGEEEFIEKVKEFGKDPTLIQKAEIQFGKPRVQELIKLSKVK